MFGPNCTNQLLIQPSRFTRGGFFFASKCVEEKLGNVNIVAAAAAVRHLLFTLN